MLLNLTLCYEQLKRFKLAVETLEIAKSLDPSNEQITRKIETFTKLLTAMDYDSVVSHGVNKDKLKLDLAKNAT